ncbi:12671_t:CDS:1, partial [Funneliformis geosporum]
EVERRRRAKFGPMIPQEEFEGPIKLRTMDYHGEIIVSSLIHQHRWHR